MKTRIVILAAILTASLTSCHNIPRDAYVEGFKSTVNTPWGPSTIESAVMATGTAAKNASLPPLVAPTPTPKAASK